MSDIVATITESEPIVVIFTASGPQGDKGDPGEDGGAGITREEAIVLAIVLGG